MRIKLCVVALCLLMLTGCAQVNQDKAIRRLSPQWWNIREARRENHPLPAIYIIFNDAQVGWLYNNGRRFTDEEFKIYVRGLAITKRCKKVKFFSGKNIFGKEVIRKAVVYYKDDKEKNGNK